MSHQQSQSQSQSRGEAAVPAPQHQQRRKQQQQPPQPSPSSSSARSGHHRSTGGNPPTTPLPPPPRGGVKKVNGTPAGQSKAAGGGGAPEPLINLNMQHSNPKTGASGAKQAMSAHPSNAIFSKPSRPTPSSSSAAETISPIPAAGRLGDTMSNGTPSFSFQFGSISPGFMHTSGMQLPARTSSAPPVLDEQKRDQARFEHGGIVAAKIPALPPGPTKEWRKPSQEVKQATVSKATPVSSTLPSSSTSTNTPPQLQVQPVVSGPVISPRVQYPIWTHNAYQGQQQAVNPHIQVPSHLFQGHVMQHPLTQHTQHTQQGLHPPSQSPIQQGPTTGYHQPLLPASHSGQQLMTSHIATMPVQLSQSRTPQIVSSQMGGSALGNPIPTNSQYGSMISSNQYNIQPRVSKAIKIVNPETREEVVFDSKARSSASNASLSGRASAKPPATNYAPTTTGIHQVNTNYYQTGNYGHSGQSSYHPATTKSSAPSIPSSLSSSGISTSLDATAATFMSSTGTSNRTDPTTVSPTPPRNALEPTSKLTDSDSNSSEIQSALVDSSIGVPVLKSVVDVNHPEHGFVASAGSLPDANEASSVELRPKVESPNKLLRSSSKKSMKKEQRQQQRMQEASMQRPAVIAVTKSDAAEVASSITESFFLADAASPAKLPIIERGQIGSAHASAKIESSIKVVPETVSKTVLKKQPSNVSLVSDSKIPCENGAASPFVGSPKDTKEALPAVVEIKRKSTIGRLSDDSEAVVVDGRDDTKMAEKPILMKQESHKEKQPDNLLTKSNVTEVTEAERTVAEKVSPTSFAQTCSTIERAEIGSNHESVSSQNIAQTEIEGSKKVLEVASETILKKQVSGLSLGTDNEKLLDNGSVLPLVEASKNTLAEGETERNLSVANAHLDTGLGKTENLEAAGKFNISQAGVIVEQDVQIIGSIEDESSNRVVALEMKPDDDDKDCLICEGVSVGTVEDKEVEPSMSLDSNMLSAKAVEISRLVETKVSGEESSMERQELDGMDTTSVILKDSMAQLMAPVQSQKKMDSEETRDVDAVTKSGPLLGSQVGKELQSDLDIVNTEFVSTQKKTSDAALKRSTNLLNSAIIPKRLTDLGSPTMDADGQMSKNSPGTSKHSSITGNHNVTDVKTGGSKKKKMKDILAKADAASGTTADLYNAYTTPSENKPEEVGSSEELTLTNSDLVENKDIVSAVKEESVSVEELEDWEDAAELSSPAVAVPTARDTSVAVSNSENRKYTRDFMLTLKDQCRDYPSDFEALPEFSDLLVNPQTLSTSGERDGRQMNRRYISDPMPDRHMGGGPMEEERWGKQPGMSPYQGRVDMSFMGSPGYRQNMDVMAGVIARLPMVSRPGMQYGMTTIPAMPLMGVSPSINDRWQRAPALQKGLMPSPQVPLPSIHKAEKKYEIGKVADEEDLKQRMVKGILNKLTPENFEKLFEKVKEVNIGSANTLKGVISQIFDKALMEPTFCEMYARFCVQLAVELPEFTEDGTKVTFKRVLLNKCQEEFERGQREQAEADEAEKEDGNVEISKEEREEKRLKAKRRMLGNIRFIGELYKKNMLTERIMHECIQTLLGDIENPDEEAVESLCKLMATIGRMIDHAKARVYMDSYFDRMKKWSVNQKLPSRLRFLLKDALDLRKSGWQERRKVEGPKKIGEVHRDAVQERQTIGSQSSRMPRGSNSGPILSRRVQGQGALDFGALNSPPPSVMGNFSQMGGLRGVQSPQVARGSYSQDIRQLADDKPKQLQRPIDDGPINLVPQWGKSKIQQQSLTGGRSVLADAPSLASGHGRFHGSLSSYNNESFMSDRGTYTNKEEFAHRSSGLERQFPTSDRSVLATPNVHQQPHPIPLTPPGSRPASSDSIPTQLNEAQMKSKSEMTLKEYFSARDLKEAACCVSELECAEFHPTMLYLWILQSMEGKDVLCDLDLLVDLIIFLSKSKPVLLKQEHITKGFESVLSMLEDTVVDVPRAPDYLARMFGKLVVEDILTLGQVGQLLRNSAAEVGSLIEERICLRILVRTLDTIQKFSTEETMLDLYKKSILHVEDFVSTKDWETGVLESAFRDANLQFRHILENQS